MDDDSDSPEAWMAATKRRNALRMLAIGLVLILGAGIWAASFWNYAATQSPITYVRVITVLVLGIGAGLAIAGALALRRR